MFAAGALRVIMRSGVGGLTVREVAREAGFTTGALTHYFTSKDQVLIQASEYAATLMRPAMERAGQDRVALRALRKVVEMALPSTPELRGYWRVWLGFWERAGYNQEVARVMRDRYAEWCGRLAEILRRARDQGEVPSIVDPALAAQEIVALVDGVSVQVLLGEARISASRQRRLVSQWVENVAAGRVGVGGS